MFHGEPLMRQLAEAHPKPFSRVFYHTLRSELDLAADWYEKAIEQRELFALICTGAKVMRPLRESRYWPRLAGLMKLPSAELDLHSQSRQCVTRGRISKQCDQPFDA
jgi:hypothetical protein